MTSGIPAKEHKRGQMVLPFSGANAVTILRMEDLHTEARKIIAWAKKFVFYSEKNDWLLSWFCLCTGFLVALDNDRAIICPEGQRSFLT